MTSRVITQAKTDRPPSNAPETSRTMATSPTRPVRAPRARARFLLSIEATVVQTPPASSARAGSGRLGGPNLGTAVGPAHLGPPERRSLEVAADGLQGRGGVARGRTVEDVESPARTQCPVQPVQLALRG